MIDSRRRVVAPGGPARRAPVSEPPAKAQAAAGRPVSKAGKVSEGPVSKAPAPRARPHPDQQLKGGSKDTRSAPPRSAEQDGGAGGGGVVTGERVVAGSWDWERYVDQQIKLLPPATVKDAACVSRVDQAERYTDKVLANAGTAGLNLAKLAALTSSLQEQHRRLSNSPAPPRPPRGRTPRTPDPRLPPPPEEGGSPTDGGPEAGSALSGGGPVVASCAGSKRVYSPMLPRMYLHLTA
ncbi:hypothetical protein T484DRAFT_1906925 [Baffinella frigidus]|nr:hypothetical protein T484DRAFT_1906925 [Cryptophyta sp. CCMP2293]